MSIVLHDLGTLLVQNGDDQSTPGGKKPAAILAALLVDVNHRVSVETLMYAAWGERATASPSTLESHIWRLRRVLEPARDAGQQPTVLVNDSGGYRLLLGPDQLDSVRYQQLADDARDLLAAGRPARALDRLDAASALWRGRPYSPMSDEDWAAPAVARLSEIHDQLAERRIDVLLALGQPEQALSDLEPLLLALPYRERLWGQRMLALHRCGRSEEALQTFQTARSVLIEEIGLEPGAELQSLQGGILDQDPALLSGTNAEPPTRSVEVHLPARTTSLIGRDSERATIGALLQQHRLVTIVGAAGSGKTRLAIEVAGEVATSSFSDGVWFLDLALVEDSDLVVDLAMSTLGVSAPTAGEPIDALRGFMRDRRLLLVADNCEHVLTGVSALARSVLSGEGECAFLTTSREPLGVGGEVLWSLKPLILPAESATVESSPAVQLFTERLRALDPTFVMDADALETIAAICVDVDGLPLAIELAAARARAYSLSEIAAQVAEDPSDLARVTDRGPESRSSMRSTIESSFQLLSPPEQDLHRQLSVLPGPFTRTAAAAIASLPEDGPQVSDVLPMLVNRSLLTATRAAGPGGPTSFRQLVTVRAHARGALAAGGRPLDMLDRRDDWVFGLSQSRPRLGRVEILPWYQAIDDDYATVRATLQRRLIDGEDPEAARLATRLLMYWYYRDQLVEGSRYLRRAVELAAHLQPFDSLASQLSLAAVETLQGRSDLARPRIDVALSTLDKVPETSWPDVGDLLVAISAAAGLADAELAVSMIAKAADFAARTADRDLQILVAAQALRAELPTRDAADPAETAARAEEIYRDALDAGQLLAAWIGCSARCLTAVQLGEAAVGLRWSQRLLAIHGRFGSRRGGPFVEMYAIFAAMAGETPKAVRSFSASQANARRAGVPWPRRPITLDLLARCRRALTQADFEQAWQDGEGLDLAGILDESSDENRS
ncbi:BTAD domain-containing putative transcriptional regulator [Jatrophihabitans sp. DSM 45814]